MISEDKMNLPSISIQLFDEQEIIEGETINNPGLFSYLKDIFSELLPAILFISGIAVIVLILKKLL